MSHPTLSTATKTCRVTSRWGTTLTLALAIALTLTLTLALTLTLKPTRYDKSLPILYYKSIGTLRPRGSTASKAPISIDLEIKLAPGSVFKSNAPDMNGFEPKSGKFGQINLGGRDIDMTTEDGLKNEATFIFTLMNQSSREPLGLDSATGEELVQFFSFKTLTLTLTLTLTQALPLTVSAALPLTLAPTPHPHPSPSPNANPSSPSPNLNP